MAIRYISDLHFGHSNIIRFDMRPFESTEEMDRELVKRWNDVVDKDDQVYVLGDMFWKKADEAIPILKELKGNKFLVRGNHDRVGDRNFDKCFACITDYTEVKDEGRHVILCHYPIFAFKNHYYDGWYHLYGHVHNTWEETICDDVRARMNELGIRCEMRNAGCMMPWMDYAPRTLNEIFGAEET